MSKSPFKEAVEIIESSRAYLKKRGYSSDTVIHTHAFVIISDEINSAEGEELEYWKKVMDKFNTISNAE